MRTPLKGITLVYLGKGCPVFIQAEIVSRHPNDTITFHVTDPVWLEQAGWKPDSHLEVQAAPVGQINRPDQYYWTEFAEVP